MTQHSETRVCKGECGLEKPVAEFYFSKRDGIYLGRCKECHKKWCQSNYQKKLEEKRAYYRDRANEKYVVDPDGERAKKAAWRKANPERARAIARRADLKRRDTEKRRQSKKKSAKRYRERHGAKIKARNAEYRERNKDALKERQKAWRLSHPEAYRAIHSKWKQANKDKVNAATHRRRYNLAKNGGDHTAEEWAALKALCDNRCLKCGRHEGELDEGLSFDHIVPVSKGGGNTIHNGQPYCRSCNSVKHARIEDLRPTWIKEVVDNGLLLAPPET